MRAVFTFNKLCIVLIQLANEVRVVPIKSHTFNFADEIKRINSMKYACLTGEMGHQAYDDHCIFATFYCNFWMLVYLHSPVIKVSLQTFIASLFILCFVVVFVLTILVRFVYQY